MKTRKYMAILAIAALTGTAALGDELLPTTITPAKGQSLVLYRSYEPSLALYTHKQGTFDETRLPLKPVVYNNPKNQAIVLYWTE